MKNFSIPEIYELIEFFEAEPDANALEENIISFTKRIDQTLIIFSFNEDYCLSVQIAINDTFKNIVMSREDIKKIEIRKEKNDALYFTNLNKVNLFEGLICFKPKIQIKWCDLNN